MRKLTLRILKTLPTKYITSGLILIIILFIYGIVGSYFIMGLNLIDSIYYATITMATVGYGDYTPHTGIQKIFATTLAIGGVALLAYVFNMMLTTFQERMNEFSKGARKLKVIENMEDYYILCGFGRVGQVVFNELNYEVLGVSKDATEDDGLIAKLAGDKCRSVILCAGDDVINLFIVLTIRETNPDAWIVTRSSRLENVKRLRKAGADKIISPEVIGGKDLYFESTRPHLLKITVKHSSYEILNEFEIITKHGCTLENIEYHLPGIETPLTRQIKTMNLSDGQRFVNYLSTHDDQRNALDNLYKTVNDVHSHLIAGPDRATFDKLVKDLEEIEEIIGINLTNKEIAKITEKEIN